MNASSNTNPLVCYQKLCPGVCALQGYESKLNFYKLESGFGGGKLQLFV